ncbi:hypothetical protein GF319_14175 [Candidatus Bathyarchaeota archaeon]|nr:hypothetical protein [Candidatus Bathyarchaeota archaeon]
MIDMVVILPVIWTAALVFASELPLISIGFMLTDLTAKVPNFAHGTYAGVGIYLIFTISKILKYSPYVGFSLAFIVGGITSVLIYKLAIGVLQKMGGGTVVLTISTLAIQIFLTASIQIYAYWLLLKYNKYTQLFRLKEYDFQFAGFPGIFIVSIGLSLATVIVFHYVLTRTRIEMAMRATAEDPQLASILGININNIQLYNWFLTGGIACLAGAMIPLWFMSTPNYWALIITSIMAGNLLGGFNNIYGAILGGAIVGISEIMLTTWGQATRGA